MFKKYLYCYKVLIFILNAHKLMKGESWLGLVDDLRSLVGQHDTISFFLKIHCFL